ncbi:uncharacterized protein LOC127804701 isoform X2 [Diospyros lotus]|uniref:uncharacterized protein LOC127804701 isoform X2 n=1 Tax=Diospyros lotus TaxID=55363 RepID=UPI002258D61D|nr:uncharacterized protein LOC127804701 isoform X2 [Diospyros lotus]
MGKQQEERHRSLRSKAANFVSDIATVFLNPISDKPSNSSHPQADNETEANQSQLESTAEKGSVDLVDTPDTSSFTAFLHSLLSLSESQASSNPDGKDEYQEELAESPSDSIMKGSGGKKSLFSRGKQSLGKALYKAARLGRYRTEPSEVKSCSDMTINDGNKSRIIDDEGVPMQILNEPVLLDDLPENSESSLLLSNKTRSTLYLALPALVQGKIWVLLYSTWRHGISLATLYRRSVLWPGLSLLVVGDFKGAVFGGLVEAPLRPTNKRKYQGTNNSFVFTNISGRPVIFRPTGNNQYFTLCYTEFLALGGGGHFALYLDGDLLNGSSGASETYGNPCLAHSQDFKVKEIERHLGFAGGE